MTQPRKKCAGNCGFYGSKQQMNYCSQCFKKKYPNGIPQTSSNKGKYTTKSKLAVSQPQEDVDIITQMCRAIGKYYESVNADYDDLFSTYCEDNGMDEDGVADELNGDPSECVITEFDEDFPFPQDTMNKNETIKNQYIFDLLNKCWKNPGKVLFDVKLPPVDKDLFTVVKQELKDVKDTYSEQCPVLYSKDMQSDESFLTMLAIGRKHRNFDYLQHLVDSYIRERINRMNSNAHGIFNEKTWSEESKHFGKFINNINVPSNAKSPKELIQSAVKAWGHRCVPQLLFTDIKQINASLESTVHYIVAAIDWISGLVKKERMCPFQMDLCIALGKPKITEQVVQTNRDQQNDYDDDDDDDDDIDEKKEKASGSKSNRYWDCIGKIEEKLKKNKLKYTKQDNNADFEVLNTRIFGQLLEGLKKKLDKGTYPHSKDQYPFKSRFVCLIDRRESNKRKSDVDHVYMYTPPNNCRDIPNDVVSEWFISSSRTCLLPNMDYGDGKEAQTADPKKNEKGKEKDETEEKLKKENIGSCSHCKGGLLTLSFIAKEEDAIKCYLYWNGQIMRFMPNDITTVFRKLFYMDWNDGNKIGIGQKSLNEAFLSNTKDIDALIRRMNSTLRDKYFDQFCQSYQ